MTFIPRPQEIYRHFKGNLYQIVAIAEHTETGERLVVYQALYGDFKTYARPLEMFTSRVDSEKYPEAKQEFRFALQGADSDRQKRESPQDEGALRGEAMKAAGREPAGGESGAAGREPAGGESGAAGPDSAAVESDAAVEETSGELQLDPLLLEFLDADTYEERLNILAALHHRVTQDMITTMAISCDIEVNDGDLEERYEALKNCLLTLERYECNRLR